MRTVPLHLTAFLLFLIAACIAAALLGSCLGYLPPVLIGRETLPLWVLITVTLGMSVLWAAGSMEGSGARWFVRILVAASMALVVYLWYRVWQRYFYATTLSGMHGVFAAYYALLSATCVVAYISDIRHHRSPRVAVLPPAL